MRYIEIIPNSLGGHRNFTGEICSLEGWAIIPETIEIPSTFPFVNIEVENGTVISMTEGVMPPVPPTPPTELERLRADVDFIMAMEGYIS